MADPLGGSYYVEALTDAIEAEAMAEIARIDDLGGMVAAVEAGPRSRRSPTPPTGSSARWTAASG